MQAWDSPRRMGVEGGGDSSMDSKLQGSGLLGKRKSRVL